MQINSFQLIPVIDLIRGQTVHAKHGQRSQYAPIASALNAGSAPHDVVAGLLKLYPFQLIYIADIDAIEDSDNNFDLIEALRDDFPQLTWWVDSGIRNVNARMLYQANIRAVIGSESMQTLQDYRTVSYAYQSRHVLSLDMRDSLALGAEELHHTGHFWSDDIIGMSLNTVGSNAGPDLTRLNALQQLNLRRKTPANIYAAGGVRDVDDLLILKKMGIKGALVASALHNGSLSAEDLKKIQQ